MALDVSEESRRRIADRVFQGSLAYTTALTIFWLFLVVTGRESAFFGQHRVDLAAVGRVTSGILIFWILWGLVWYGVKSLLLGRFCGFSQEERRLAFRSRMTERFDLPGLLLRHSERRIRIADMIGRRGRFITIQTMGFYFLYLNISQQQSPKFMTLFLQDNAFEAVVSSWVTLALYYSNGWFARMFYGAQSRVMDGTLARANCLLIMTLWSAFKFALVPIGIQLAALFRPSTYAVLFALIWGTYMAADASSEIVGSLIGRQRLRVWGMGDVNRKSVAGTVGGFLAALALGLTVVLAQGLPWPWVALAVLIAISNSLLELFSPRGTDDLTMATGNALLCWGFGLLFY